MAKMILQMTASTVIYIIITGLMWKIWSRRSHSLELKIAVGVIFGLCSVLATHMGVDYGDMVLNVRDMGALAAGLFFDPLSGLIAGFIAGIERYIAGTCMSFGAFTTNACSLSTCLAGILSALLNRYLYRGKRPPAMHAFFIGAVMEVFHMYAIFITNREHMMMAYYVVRSCAAPMILFNGLGVLACALFIKYLSGEKQKRISLFDYERTPIALRFHRWLFVVTIIVFCINYLMDYGLLARNSYEEASEYLYRLTLDCQMLYEDMADEPEIARKVMPYIAMVMNDDALYVIFDRDKKVVSSLYSAESGNDTLPESDYKDFMDHLGKGVFRRNIQFYGGLDALCTSVPLDDNLFFTALLRYDTLSWDLVNHIYENMLADILLFTVLYLLISVLIDALVVRGLKSVNGSLHKIIGGDLGEIVSVRTSSEFTLLSEDINKTVATLKGYIDESEKRMEQELKLAALIQESALPHVFDLPRKDFEIYALMDPARQVGGDFYDFFFVDIDRLALVIADVSGKGIPAAMFMMRAKTAIVNTARVKKSAAEVLCEVNNILCEGNDAEMFVSVWIGIIDLRTGIMQCSNAGHEYPVLYREGAGYELLRDRHGLVLAAMENAPEKEYTIEFHPGDKLFVYTDGVPEAINSKEEAYGTDRLMAKLNTLGRVSQKETLHEVHRDISLFAGDAEQFDDITMMGFTWTP